MTFLGLAEDPEKARVVILPAPYDGTTSYVPGTRFGPRRIIEASPYLEFYDEETETEVYRRAPFLTLPEPELPLAAEEAVHTLKEILRPHLARGLFPVTLGGEHTVSLAPLSLLAERHPDLCLVQIDAHADLRDVYQGSRFSHACVMRRALELGVRLFQVGLRALSREEAEFIRTSGHRVFWAREALKDPAGVGRRIFEEVGGVPVYVTIDLDGLDPSEVPGVGTPEPGGLRWYDVLDLLRELSRAKIVGFDVVELLPLPHEHRSEFLAARLVYKFLSYLFS